MLLDEAKHYNSMSELFRDDMSEYALASASVGDPKTLDEAFCRPFAEDWKRAWDNELGVLKRLGTWKIVNLPPGMPTIPCHPAFKSKRGPDGQVVRRKIRLVAGGHMQSKGVNYDETFSSAAKMASNRIVLAYATQQDWELHQVDVVGAYLNANLTDKIYMRPPVGILKKGEEGKVCRLLKGLYGLKQAGREWYLELRGTLVGKMEFTWSSADHSVFYRHNKPDGSVIIAVSTDDMVVAADSIRFMPSMHSSPNSPATTS
jgi:Reverse transcriptase (RNA-dependent DNA polymerase)